MINSKIIQKCVTAMLLLNVLAWLIFHMMDAIAEFLLHEDYFLDAGLLSIPCILTVFYMIIEKKLFGTVRFNAKFNLCMSASFIIFGILFGAIVWQVVITEDIWLIPQDRSGYFNFNGIEYGLFPFTYGIVSLILGLVIKLISYILYRKKRAKDL